MRTSARCMVLLFALLTLPARRAAADAETAEASCASNPTCQALFVQAKESSSLDNWSETARLYKAAYEVSPDPILLFNIARMLHKQGQVQEAAAYYQQFLRSPVDNVEQKGKAQEYLNKILRSAGATAPALSVPSPVLEPPLQAPAAAPSLRQEPELASRPPTLASPPEHAAKTDLGIRSTPIYKKWWLWTLVGVVVAGTATAIGLRDYASTGPDPAGLPIFRPFGN